MLVDVKQRDKHLDASISMLESFLNLCGPQEFNVRLWDGTELQTHDTDKPQFSLILKHPGSLRRMFLNASDLTLGEAYIFDDFDIKGDIETVYQVGERLVDEGFGLKDKAFFARKLLKLPSGRRFSREDAAAEVHGETHSRERDRQAITFHYDVSNEFYSLWLDRNMVYSCAYFATADDDINKAQEAKLEYICKKLRLRPGEQLLDIGCGWGGLIRHAVRNYGVRALGVTLSEQQAALANQRIAEEDLTKNCRVEIRDYRDIDNPSGFDKVVSVGMFEHVGEAMLPTYFEQALRLLKPGGVFLNHGISTRYSEASRKKNTDPTFIRKYVFPDGELVTIGRSLEMAENAGFEVRDVESLREHYMWTLRKWVSRLEQHHDDAVAATDEVTYRIWRLFMSLSAYGFRTGRINVYQTLLSKPDNGVSGLPLQRADWYQKRD